MLYDTYIYTDNEHRTTKIMKILCIGEALIDMICTDHGSTLAEGENFIKKTGGAPTNVAAAIGALGGEVAIAAHVGPDPFGALLIKTMKDFNVSTEFMSVDAEKFTTLAFVSLLNDGGRDFYFNRGADAELPESLVDAIDFSQYKIIHFGSATAFLPGTLQKTYYAMLNKALQNNCYVSFDPNYRSALFENDKPTFIAHSEAFIKHSHFFKVSDEEAMLITHTTDLDTAVAELEKMSDATFVITLGKDGALLRHGENKITVETLPVKSIDSTGAGDAFVGAVLMQLTKMFTNDSFEVPLLEWKKIVGRANYVGAQTCTHFGAMEAFKHLDKSMLG